ncbi:MAG: chordopoxvirus fusion protein, partial [Moorellales bacterium]
KRTEQRLEELAEAQKRTEKALQKLSEEHLETRRQLGGLAMTVGYTLENEAYKALPALLERDYGLVVEGRLKRSHVAVENGDYLEVNILGDGMLGGRRVKIVGESKAQLSQNDVDRFIRRKLNLLKKVFPDVFPVLVTHMVTSPKVEEYARSKGVAVYCSYDF